MITDTLSDARSSDAAGDLTADVTTFTYFRGRVALHALLRALGVCAGRKVAMQAYTCVAVPEAALAAGAVPQWVDTEPHGVNMSPDSLRRAIDGDTAAIVVQHTFGIPARIDEIVGIARAAGIPLIEDCCHTISSTFAGRRMGTFGAGAFYSFEWGKPLVAGIGGSASSSDPAICAALARDYDDYLEPGFALGFKVTAQYHVFKKLYRPSTYWTIRSVFRTLSRFGAAKGNYNELEAAAPDFHLRMIDSSRRRLVREVRKAALFTAHARSVARAYTNGIRNAAVRVPEVPPAADAVYARFPLFCDDKPSILAGARGANVEMSDWYYTPVHPLQGAALSLVHYAPGMCPHAESAAARTVSLPTQGSVAPQHVERAVDLINRFSP